MSLNKRERKLLYITLAIIAVTVNWILVRPLFSRWATLKQDLATQRDELQLMRATIAQEPEWRKRHEQLGGSVRATTERFQQTTDVLKKIEEMGSTAGIVISARRPLPAEDKVVYRVLPVQCTVESNIEPLVKFLFAMQTSAGFMRVEQLQVSPRPDNPSILRCDIQIRALAGKSEVPAS